MGDPVDPAMLPRPLEPKDVTRTDISEGPVGDGAGKVTRRSAACGALPVMMAFAMAAPNISLMRASDKTSPAIPRVPSPCIHVPGVDDSERQKPPNANVEDARMNTVSRHC